jgi:hypothetical protein
VLSDGRTGNYLGAVGQRCPGLVLAVGTALTQQHSPIAFDEPDDLPGRHKYSLAASRFKCLVLNTSVEGIRSYARMVAWRVSGKRDWHGGYPAR